VKKVINGKKISRKQLEDPKLGLSYKERIEQTKVAVKIGGFKIEEASEGYFVKKIRLD